MRNFFTSTQVKYKVTRVTYMNLLGPHTGLTTGCRRGYIPGWKEAQSLRPHLTTLTPVASPSPLGDTVATDTAGEKILCSGANVGGS